MASRGGYRGGDSGRGGGRGGGSNTCFTCGQAGHMSRDCPNDSRGSGRGGGGRGGGGSTCFTCGQTGHMSRECPKASHGGGGGDFRGGRGGGDFRGGRGGSFEDRGGRGGGSDSHGGRGGGGGGGHFQGGGGRGGGDFSGGRGGAPRIDRDRPLEVKSLPSTSIPAVRMENSLQPLLFGGRRQKIIVGQGNAKREDVQRALQSVANIMQNVQSLPPGKAGSATSVISNLYSIAYTQKSCIYQYNAVLEPEVKNRKRRNGIIQELLKDLARSANQAVVPITNQGPSDSTIVYSPYPIKEAVIKRAATAGATGWRGKDTSLTMSLTRTIDVDQGVSTECYNVLGTILRQGLETCGLDRCAGRFFDFEGKFIRPQEDFVYRQNDPAGTLILAHGLDVTIYPTQRGLMLNADLAFRVARSSTALAFINSILASGARDPHKAVKSELTETICLCTYSVDQRRQTFFVTDVLFDMTPDSIIPGENPKKITFLQYMKDHHGLDVRDRKQPLLESRSKKEKDREGNPRVYYYLPEFARIAGQSPRMRADTRLQQDLKKTCIVDPFTRFTKINDIVDKLLKTKQFCDLLRSWGIGIDPRPVEVRARSLLIPQLLIDNGRQTMDIRKSMWMITKRTRMQRAPPTPKKWVVYHDKGMDPSLFIATLMDTVVNAGVIGHAWPEPQRIAVSWTRSPETNKEIIVRELDRLNPEQCHFVLVILPDNGDELYNAFKRGTLCRAGIPSQGLLQRNAVFDERKPNHIANVSSRVGGQMLVKAGGALWGARTSVKGALIIGYEVLENAVAISACMRSDTLDLYQSYSEGSKNKLRTLISKAIEDFKSINKASPTAIILYRSGMSEGDLDVIIHDEASPINETLTKHKIPFCFIAALKRCHVRYHPAQPGSIIDCEITSPVGHTFLIIPQVVNQGTATPMKFSVVMNSTALSADDIQGLTFALCHTYYGWWAAVREPSVVMYATREADMRVRTQENLNVSGLRASL